MLNPSRLAVARKRWGLTLTRLADLTDISTRSLSAYENGHQTPSEETLLLLADSARRRPCLPRRAGHRRDPAGRRSSFRALSKMTARQRE